MSAKSLTPHPLRPSDLVPHNELITCEASHPNPQSTPARGATTTSVVTATRQQQNRIPLGKTGVRTMLTRRGPNDTALAATLASRPSRKAMSGANLMQQKPMRKPPAVGLTTTTGNHHFWQAKESKTKPTIRRKRPSKHRHIPATLLQSCHQPPG